MAGRTVTLEPEETDLAHDLLAHLAECMMALQEEKQKLLEGF